MGAKASLESALSPFDGDYSKLFTPGKTLKYNEAKGWVITRDSIPSKDRETFFKDLASHLARENMKPIEKPALLAKRINEAWFNKIRITPQVQDQTIFFSSKNQNNGFLSNFQPTLISADSHMFPSSEHFYQWLQMKKLDPSTQHWGHMKTLTPLQVKNYTASNKHGQELPTNEKIKLMARVIQLKYNQNPVLKTALVGTDPYKLVEATDSSFWGQGQDRSGQNNLGKLLELNRTRIIEKKKKESSA